MFGGLLPYHYFRCRNCRFIFQAPIPDEATIASFYPDSYEIYAETKRSKTKRLQLAYLKNHKNYKHLKPSFFPSLLSKMSPALGRTNAPMFRGKGRLLDFGCGNGSFMKKMIAFGWSAQGIEFSSVGVGVCHEQGLNVHHGNLLSAPFPDNSFDLITMRHVIEHVPNPSETLKKAAALLDRGGFLFVETPNSQALGRSIFNSGWYANEVPRHLCLFDSENLEQLGMSVGLELVNAEASTTPKLFLNSLDYALGRRTMGLKRSQIFRMLAKVYVFSARRMKREDIIHMTFQKS
jgi:2-polyprenyl-3-methyl-5-hydroxy-6-metoxy-1,4-benzoquinol methylase